MAEQTVYILDQVTPKPGMAKQFLDTYMEKYAPAARERGMTLEKVLVAPPMWLEDQSNQLFIMWSVQGPAAWWGMSHQGRRNPAVAAFWEEEAAPLILSRSRCFPAEASSVEALCNV
jgi:hypothetical protein